MINKISRCYLRTKLSDKSLLCHAEISQDRMSSIFIYFVSQLFAYQIIGEHILCCHGDYSEWKMNSFDLFIVFVVYFCSLGAEKIREAPFCDLYSDAVLADTVRSGR